MPEYGFDVKVGTACTLMLIDAEADYSQIIGINDVTTDRDCLLSGPISISHGIGFKVTRLIIFQHHKTTLGLRKNTEQPVQDFIEQLVEVQLGMDRIANGITV